MEIVLNDSNFEQGIQHGPVVLVDFWAPWCGPCRSLSPVISEIAAEYDGRVTVAKCNVDDCDEVPDKCGIRSIPTLIFYKNGEVAQRTTGALPKTKITEILDSLL